jgi:hypothetical protein
LLLESLILASVACVCGMVLAVWGVTAFHVTRPLFSGPVASPMSPFCGPVARRPCAALRSRDDGRARACCAASRRRSRPRGPG